MLIASVHDPQVFSPTACEDPTTMALIIDHLMHMAHCHLFVCDEDGRIGKAITDSITELPDCIRIRLNAAICPQRVVRLKPGAGFRELAELYEPEAAGSAAALAFCDSPEIDAVVTTDLGKGVLSDVGLDGSRAFSLSGYAKSPMKMREFDSMGSLSLNSMPTAQFCDEVIKPVVKFAGNIVIIDKMLSTSRFGENPDDRNRSNWSNYKRTIRLIHDTWRRHCMVEKDAFVIVTVQNREWRAPWHAPFVENGLDRNFNKQAQSIAEELDLEKGNIVVKVISQRGDLRALEHDRYLVTNQNVVLNFTRGFDLIGNNNRSVECAVALYRERNNDTVSRVLAEANRPIGFCEWR